MTDAIGPGEDKVGQRRVAGLTFLVCLGGFYIKANPRPEVDCVPSIYGGWALVTGGTFELQHFEELKPYVTSGILRDVGAGRWVSKYPPGTMVATAPIAAIGAPWCDGPLAPNRMAVLGKLSSALYVAAAVALLAAMMRRCIPEGWVPATLLIGLGSVLTSVAAQASWGHGPATFCLALALYFLTRTHRPEQRDGVVAGLALGLAVCTRPTVAIFLIATLLGLLCVARWRVLLPLLVSCAVPIVLAGAYNHHYFGAVVATGYGDEVRQWTTPLHVGLAGLLVAPSRGLFVYSPALLLAPLGIASLVRKGGLAPTMSSNSRAILLAWGVAGVVTVALYARWHMWWGGWSYGPRFLCETIPIFGIFYGAAHARLRHRATRTLAWSLVGLSIAIQFIGLFGYNGYADWQERHVTGDTMFSLEDTQIEAHARAILGIKNPTGQ